MELQSNHNNHRKFRANRLSAQKNCPKFSPSEQKHSPNIFDYLYIYLGKNANVNYCNFIGIDSIRYKIASEIILSLFRPGFFWSSTTGGERIRPPL